MKNKIFIAIVAGGMISSHSIAQNVPQLREDNIDEIIQSMTTEEKVHVCIGTGMAGVPGMTPVVGSTQLLVPGTAGTSYPVPRLGIPSIAFTDGPAGVRIDPKRDFDSKTYYCTHFPIGTALACSWNTELVNRVGSAMGEEVLEYGSDILLAPALNIHRHTLCGRNFEYYSEDPVVSGEIAKAYILGVQSRGVGTSIKHFIANNQETYRSLNDARISQRALREIYLKGFEIAIKGSAPWTVMSSYNKVNGSYTSENRELLTDILRDEWGYEGMVVTDWFGGQDVIAQINAGNDMIQPGTLEQYNILLEGVKSGQVTEDALDSCVRRVLGLIVKSPHFKRYKYSDSPDLKEHAAITRSSATEGVVLLKNDDTLPIVRDVRNIGVYGYSSYDIIPGGTGSGNVSSAYTVSLIEGLRNAGYTADKKIQKRYKTYMDSILAARPVLSFGEQTFNPVSRPVELVPVEDDLKEESAANDMALVTLGRIPGESRDCVTSEFNLTKEEKDLLYAVTEAYHEAGKKVVVILNIGNVIETASWKSLPDAILCTWLPGQEAGNSIADVLSGKKYPSGKLTMTFPINITDAASSENFPIDAPFIDIYEMLEIQKKPSENRKNYDYTNYEEDIYVGYRFFDTFDKEVSYPFGYGLSYTVFTYGEPVLERDGDECRISVDITNEGNFAGKEIVQLYVEAPKGKLDKPRKELKAFIKTKELNPGEKQTVTMTIKIEDLASYNPASSSWVTDKGDYNFLIAASIQDIKGNIVRKIERHETKTGDKLKPAGTLNTLKSK